MLLRSSVLILSLFIASCGFTPVYKSEQGSSEAHGVLASVRVNTQRGLTEQFFSSRLNDLLNPRSENVPAKYDLDVKLSAESTPLAIQQDRTVTRFKVTVKADYVLRNRETGEIISEEDVLREGGYDKVDSDYATYVSEEDTKRRVTKELAEDMKLRLMSLLLR